MATFQAPGRAALVAAREALLLEEATRRAAGYSEGARTRLRALVREGHERALLAEQAAADGYAGSALELFREAALIFMRARLAADGVEPAPEASAAEVVARFHSLRLGAARDGDRVDETIEPILGPREAAPAPEVLARAHGMVRRLRSLVEPRGVAELRFERRLRVGLASLALLALVGWPLSSQFGYRNVALHKPVTTSGSYPGAPTPPGGLTDGVITGASYGVHTNIGDAPWVEVDLLGRYNIAKVKVYNRGDGWLNDGLPMTLRISEDHVHYVDVATRTTTFEQTSPWVVHVGRRPARYVRISGPRGGYIALSELEVLAKKN